MIAKEPGSREVYQSSLLTEIRGVKIDS